VRIGQETRFDTSPPGNKHRLRTENRPEYKHKSHGVFVFGSQGPRDVESCDGDTDDNQIRQGSLALFDTLYMNNKLLPVAMCMEKSECTNLANLVVGSQRST
jgi:hypothetical protein